jgi:hypothetical protein
LEASTDVARHHLRRGLSSLRTKISREPRPGERGLVECIYRRKSLTTASRSRSKRRPHRRAGRGLRSYACDSGWARQIRRLRSRRHWETDLLPFAKRKKGYNCGAASDGGFRRSRFRFRSSALDDPRSNAIQRWRGGRAELRPARRGLRSGGVSIRGPASTRHTGQTFSPFVTTKGMDQGMASGLSICKVSRGGRRATIMAKRSGDGVFRALPLTVCGMSTKAILIFDDEAIILLSL